MLITGIANVMLGASDLDRSRAFYRDQLGLAVKQEIPGFVFLETGTGHPLPQRGPRRAGRASGSVGSRAGGGERARGLQPRSRNNGVEFLREPANVTGASWAANFRDPDGHLLSIFGPE